MSTQSAAPTTLDTHTNHPTTTTTITPPLPHQSQSQPQVYTYYHAGPLFTQGDLFTNVLLCRAITRLSSGKLIPLLPQDLEQRGHVTPHNIRDKDIRALLACDLALFTYDGAELDSGTVVEFMLAKMADVPSVVLRSDFRGGGDQGSHPTGAGEPWNLMSSFYPRTKSVVVDGMMQYKAALADALRMEKEAVDVSRIAGENMIEATARKCVEALEEVVKMPARMPWELRQSVFKWLALMPGYAEGRDEDDVDEMEQLLKAKEIKGLFKQ
ncbi:Putative nucleoside 2-deoxyribosyltransferase [Septoria linicola]|uniref:Nucleoside 2-deoxyribosyltransferase n=1 Tax=Septoria linicola TaxID=215465 RepID=A0A9Q9ARN9_9PEZI|nr:putative nucleoside 2-deoxyribosyltransferase [Septoria linicola]USW50817.1 Putative nucleoside 2-deoxyribosyltransferase [Septoria linicola]